MAKGLITRAYLENTADAIRVLRGESDTYTPDEFGEKIIDAIPTETASGNPINITDAANLPAESAVTTLEPVQDLHGYSKPWPAGGGKNLLPITAESQTINGVTFTVNKDNAGNVVSVTANGTATNLSILRIGTYTLKAGTYILTGCPNGGSTATFYLDWRTDSSTQLVDIGNGSTYMSEGQNGYSQIVIQSGTTCNNLVFKPMIRLASVTDTTFEPYSNECPISGHTGVYLINGTNVSSDGITTLEPIQEGSGDPSPKNIRPILPAFSFERDNGDVLDVYGCEIDWVNGVLRVTKVAFTATNFSNWSYQTYANFKALYIQLSNLGLQECDANKKNDTLFNKFKTVPGGTVQPFGTASMYVTNSVSIVYLWNNDDFYADEASMKQGMANIGGVQFCYPLATPIEIALSSSELERVKEALKTETHSVTFPQAQSPVYGGEVDWVQGVLRVNRKFVTATNNNIGNGAISAAGLNLGKIADDAKPFSNGSLSTVKSDSLQTVTADTMWNSDANSVAINSSGRVLISIAGITRFVDLQTYLSNNPIQVCYELATPIEITLTPEVITLLKGENNVWTDAGTNEIEYKVDLQSYIQKLINEASAQANTLSMSPLSLGKSAAVSTDEESGEAEELPVEGVESVDEADEVEEEPAELPVEEDTKSKPIESKIRVKEPDTLEKEDGDSD